MFTVSKIINMQSSSLFCCNLDEQVSLLFTILVNTQEKLLGKKVGFDSLFRRFMVQVGNGHLGKPENSNEGACEEQQHMKSWEAEGTHSWAHSDL